MSDLRKPDGSHRVVITGTGVLSPAGAGTEVLWQALMDKRSCIGVITRFDTEGFFNKIAGQIPDYDPSAFGFSKKDARRFAPFVQYAMIASDEALAQAHLDLEAEDPTRLACVWGSGIGGIGEFEDGCITLHEKGAKRVSPLFIPVMIENMAAGNLSIRYGLKGDCISIVTACATGSHCIGEAYRLVRHGYADVALAGGSEESIVGICLAGFGNLGAITKNNDPATASRPFDVERSGFVPGEGAAAMVLESLEHAQARGATIIAELAGFGCTGDAYHMTAPEPSGEGAIRAMRQALAEGGFTPDDLGHLNAHGTSTPANDAMESAALKGLCGAERGSRVPVTSVKGCTGHTLGAAGAIEAVICALSVARSCVPPTLGTRTIDPACGVNVALSPLTDYPQKVALSNSLGFGGHNASLAFAPWKE